MKLLIRGERVIGRATNAHIPTGEDIVVDEPDGFDVSTMEECAYVNGVLIIPTSKQVHNKALLAKILPLHQKALRALIEDAPDVTFLNQHKAAIAALRAQWQN
jgi:hypothetical protein